jgi:hypothetical protein
MSVLVGTVTKVKPGYGDPEKNPSIFTVLNNYNKQEYAIYCPFFCPAHKDDTLFGIVHTNSENGIHTFVNKPAVQLPSDAERIKQAFQIALRGVYLQPGTQDNIYNFFKERTLANLRKDPSLLKSNQSIEDLIVENIVDYMDLPKPEAGLSNILDPKAAERLVSWWKSNYTLRRLYLLGLTKTEIRESCDRGWYPTTLYEQLLANPMVVETIPYDKACDIANIRFINLGDKDRECGKIVRYIDQESSKNGWTCYPMFRLGKAFPQLFDLQAYLKLVFKCEIRYNFIYIRHQAETENALVECLVNQDRPPTTLHIPVSDTPDVDIESDSDDDIDDDDIPPEELELLREARAARKASLRTVDEKGPTEIMPAVKGKLTQRQGSAVSMVLTNTVSVITGPAGTGKTTVISQLAEELELRQVNYLICTPTGKAAARLKEVVRRTDRVMTLHMFLSRYDHIRDPIGVLIIDEASMVNNALMARVVRRLYYGLTPSKMGKQFMISIVCVGDKNQLQPIEPGDIFNQLLLSQNIPRVVLTQDHRRANKGTLYKNMRILAKHHNAPEKRKILWGEDTHLNQGSFEQVYDLFQGLVDTYGIDNVTVICPYNDETRTINKALQDILIPLNNANQREVGQMQTIDEFKNVWRVGSRVMMLENRYDINVMNGEQGIVTKIGMGEPGVWVLFQGRDESCFIPCYGGATVLDDDIAGGWENRLEQPLSTKFLALSWCLTVDKSQGSQWKAVIFFIPGRRGSGFVHWKRVYTALSRAKEDLYIVSENIDQIYQSLMLDPPIRFDNLASRLDNKPYETVYSRAC